MLLLLFPGKGMEREKIEVLLKGEKKQTNIISSDGLNNEYVFSNFL